MLQDKTPKFQFVHNNLVLVYKGTAVVGDKEEIENFLSSLPFHISNSNDMLVSFTYYDDENYFAEKIKTYYDFRLKKNHKHAYSPSLNFEDSHELYEKFIELYEKIREDYLQKSKDKVITMIDQGFSATSKSLQVMRNKLIEKCDWTQLPDVDMSDHEKNLWKIYRQTLRDITKESTWESSDVFSLDFPIDPATYILRYPNSEVEYLSTPDQFENQLAARTKAKLLGFIDYLRIPSLEQTDVFEESSYRQITEYINKKLKKIDPDLRIVIEGKRIPDDPINTMNLQSGYTQEMVDLVSRLISDPEYKKNHSDEELGRLQEYVDGYNSAKSLLDTI
jgi:hypothetical protein